MINRRKVTVLILGSKDCKRPFRDAYSSAKIDSFKKARAPLMERSMKLMFLNTYLSFLAKSLPISNAAPTVRAIPTMADMIYARPRCDNPFPSQPLKA
jgi:hypothetical protein